MEKLPPITDPRLLVGANQADDAGVVQIRDDLALVQTVDFFTPIVDDPYTYGLISAANSLSDVYAMGGKPLSALNIVGFPKDLFPIEVLTAILQGGQDKCAEAATLIVGGHTISDDELKYGLAVTGLIHPKDVITNAGACPGDLLYLTKPIGTGTITTALKAGLGSAEMERRVCEVMARLNRDAAAVCNRIGVHACTDITGFGLMGHALELARASRVGLVFEFHRIPILPDALITVAQGAVPGGSRANRLFVAPDADYSSRLSEEQILLLCDAQTSGGLFIAAAENKQKAIESAFIDAGVEAVCIGWTVAEPVGRIAVR